MLTIVSLQRAEGHATPLKINRYRVTVAINNQLTKTKIAQVFVNPNDFEVEGLYKCPLWWESGDSGAYRNAGVCRRGPTNSSKR